MSGIAYVNGSYVRSRDAVVPIEDRGYQFADGVYEVCEVFGGALIDEARHLDRLARSLTELRIDPPVKPAALRIILREILSRNKVLNGYLYIQATRGVARRDHIFPQPSVRPSLVVTARKIDPEKGEASARSGVAVITTPDLRWKRVDIKSISLLPNVLARQEAKEKGAYEAWLTDSDGMISEGAASNAWIVDRSGTIVTRQLDRSILRGVTHDAARHHLRARLSSGRAQIQPQGSARRAGGLHHRGNDPRHAGRRNRRTQDRRGDARSGRPETALAVSSGRRPLDIGRNTHCKRVKQKV